MRASNQVQVKHGRLTSSSGTGLAFLRAALCNAIEDRRDYQKSRPTPHRVPKGQSRSFYHFIILAASRTAGRGWHPCHPYVLGQDPS